mmetsp:Transcript_22637/g.33646  ORF Transcript_22637/g.33646 Transcript_22637/m.33646 type:complete len:241 (+) Transcript_22637:186-908(+)|eukprot:scaffold2415_cov98-Skeletonema_dohrnii-CCMP3373.AAC.3
MPTKDATDETPLLGIGDEAPDFELRDEEGNLHKLSSFRGRRVMLSFFRYASCPVCLYNVDRLKQQAALLQKAEIVTLCIFRSAPTMMQRAADGTNEDTHTLSDLKGSVYKKFQVKPSLRVRSIYPYMSAIFGKYSPYVDLKMMLKDIKDKGRLKQFNDIKGKGGDEAMLQLPADFLIDENGIIVDVFRSETPQDHMEFERIEAFIPKGKRCKCRQKDCISPTCRETYAQIRKDAESMTWH